LNLYGETQVTC